MTKWFTQKAIEEAKIKVYDRSTNTIEIDETKLNVATEVFASFRNHATKATQRHTQMTGKILPAYDEGLTVTQVPMTK